MYTTNLTITERSNFTKHKRNISWNNNAHAKQCVVITNINIIFNKNSVKSCKKMQIALFLTIFEHVYNTRFIMVLLFLVRVKIFRNSRTSRNDSRFLDNSRDILYLFAFENNNKAYFEPIKLYYFRPMILKYA